MRASLAVIAIIVSACFTSGSLTDGAVFNQLEPPNRVGDVFGETVLLTDSIVVVVEAGTSILDPAADISVYLINTLTNGVLLTNPEDQSAFELYPDDIESLATGTFGQVVASDGGLALVVGGPPTVWVYDFFISTAIPTPILFFSEQPTIFSKSDEVSSLFGNSVAISGPWLAVAEPSTSTGNEIHLYTRSQNPSSSSPWTQNSASRPFTTLSSPLGSSSSMVLTMSSNTLVASEPTLGLVHIWKRNINHSQLDDDDDDDIWTWNGTVTNPVPSQGIAFGEALSLHNNDSTLFISDPSWGTSSNATGRVYVYQYSSSAWSLIQTIHNPTPFAGERFGAVLSVSQWGLAVGTPLDKTSEGGDSYGSVELFISSTSSGSSWNYNSTLVNSPRLPNEEFGASVSTQGSFILVGVPGQGDGFAYLISSCGDGILDPWETCDDGNNANDDGCDFRCSLELCGNRLVQAHLGEECDDGNSIQGDGCHNCVLEYCGDGIINNAGIESCEGTVNCTYCQPPVCGDGIVAGEEECDEAGQPSLTCDDDCVLIACGNNKTQLGEQCDVGGANSTICDENCIFIQCGNGILQEPAEACDEGEDNAEQCPYGLRNCTRICTDCGWVTAVTPRFCGDGVIEGEFEECDPEALEVRDNLNNRLILCDPEDCRYPFSLGDHITFLVFGPITAIVFVLDAVQPWLASWSKKNPPVPAAPRRILNPTDHPSVTNTKPLKRTRPTLIRLLSSSNLVDSDDDEPGDSFDADRAAATQGKTNSEGVEPFPPSADAIKQEWALFKKIYKDAREAAPGGDLRQGTNPGKERALVHSALMERFKIGSSLSDDDFVKTATLGVVTTAPVETIGVASAMEELVHHEEEGWHFYVGRLRGTSLRVVMTKSDQATIGGFASSNAAHRLYEDWGANAVLAVGIAWGVTRLVEGDVLVANEVQPVLEGSKIRLQKPRQVQPRFLASLEEGIQAFNNNLLPTLQEIKDQLVDQSSLAVVTRPPPMVGAVSGLVISKPELLAVKEKTLSVLKRVKRKSQKDAIGGEMEMSGLITVCEPAGVTWGAIKAVSDHAGVTGFKHKAYQPLAVFNAVKMLQMAAFNGDWNEDVLPPPSGEGLPVIDFGDFIRKKAEGFVGRTELSKSMRKWLQDPQQDKLRVLTDFPGGGKTSWVASRVLGSLDSSEQESLQVAAYHFCQFERPNTLDGHKVVMSLTRQLLGWCASNNKEVHVAKVKALAHNPQMHPWQIFESILAVFKADDEAEAIQRKNLGDSGEKKMAVLLLDSLDEAFDSDQAYKFEVPDLLKPRVMAVLPSWLKVIATCRPDPRLDRLADHTTIVVSEAERVKDIHTFVELAVSKMNKDGEATPDQVNTVIDAVVNRSGGIFLYAAQVMSSVQSLPALIQATQNNQMPTGLNEVYRTRADLVWSGDRDAPIRQVLSALVVSNTALPVSLLETAFLASGKDLRPFYGVQDVVSGPIAPVLDRLKDGRVRLFHKSFEDWLKSEGWGAEGNLTETELADAHKLLWDGCLQEWKTGTNEPARVYAAVNAVSHLRSWAEIGTRLQLKVHDPYTLRQTALELAGNSEWGVMKLKHDVNGAENFMQEVVHDLGGAWKFADLLCSSGNEYSPDKLMIIAREFHAQQKMAAAIRLFWRVESLCAEVRPLLHLKAMEESAVALLAVDTGKAREQAGAALRAAQDLSIVDNREAIVSAESTWGIVYSVADGVSPLERGRAHLFLWEAVLHWQTKWNDRPLVDPDAAVPRRKRKAKTFWQALNPFARTIQKLIGERKPDPELGASYLRALREYGRALVYDGQSLRGGRRLTKALRLIPETDLQGTLFHAELLLDYADSLVGAGVRFPEEAAAVVLPGRRVMKDANALDALLEAERIMEGLSGTDEQKHPLHVLLTKNREKLEEIRRTSVGRIRRLGYPDRVWTVENRATWEELKQALPTSGRVKALPWLRERVTGFRRWSLIVGLALAWLSSLIWDARLGSAGFLNVFSFESFDVTAAAALALGSSALVGYIDYTHSSLFRRAIVQSGGGSKDFSVILARLGWVGFNACAIGLAVAFPWSVEIVFAGSPNLSWALGSWILYGMLGGVSLVADKVNFSTTVYYASDLLHFWTAATAIPILGSFVVQTSFSLQERDLEFDENHPFFIWSWAVMVGLTAVLPRVARVTQQKALESHLKTRRQYEPVGEFFEVMHDMM